MLISTGNNHSNRHITAGNHSRIGTHSGGAHLKSQSSQFKTALSSSLIALLSGNLAWPFNTQRESLFELSKLVLAIISE